MKDPLSPELLAVLCHDLRGPLGALGTWVHVLGSEKADSDMRVRALAAMAKDVRVMGALIEQVSTLASTLSGSEAVSLVSIDLVPFLKSMAASEGGVEVRHHGSESPLHVLADAGRLRQVLWPFVCAAQGHGDRAHDLTVALDGDMATITVTTGSPRPLTLALVRALVESQGGVFRSVVEEGKTILSLRFPLAR